MPSPHQPNPTHQQRHRRHCAPKHHHRPRHRPSPVLLLAQLQIAQRRQDIRQDARRRGADDLKHRAQVADLRRNDRRAPHQRRRQHHMRRRAHVVRGAVVRVRGGARDTVGSGGG